MICVRSFGLSHKGGGALRIAALTRHINDLLLSARILFSVSHPEFLPQPLLVYFTIASILIYTVRETDQFLYSYGAMFRIHIPRFLPFLIRSNVESPQSMPLRLLLSQDSGARLHPRRPYRSRRTHRRSPRN